MGKWLFTSACVHLGARGCRQDLFERSLRTAKKLNADIALIGDTLDVGGYVGTAHAGSLWDNNKNPQEQLDLAIKLLKPYAKQIKVILTGNHEDRMFKAAGLHLNKQVAVGIGREEVYKDTSATLNVNGRRVMLAHGNNGGDFRKALMGSEGLDAIVLGHTHQLYSELVRRRGPKGLRDVLLVRSGTYLQEPRYGKLAMYPPNPVGGAWLYLGNTVTAELGVTPKSE